MKTTFKSSTKVKALDIENKEEDTKIFGTFLIILSGIILYLDKIFTFFNITVNNLHGWSDQENYIWSLCQTISPVLIMAGMYMRAYFVALAVPVFCYSLQFYFVMNSTLTIDRPLTWVYVTGTSILTLITIYFIRRLAKIIVIKRTVKYEDSRTQSRYQKIKLLINSAEECYDSGEIDEDMYFSLIESIEKDFLDIKRKIDDDDASKILNGYISKLS